MSIRQAWPAVAENGAELRGMPSPIPGLRVWLPARPVPVYGRQNGSWSSAGFWVRFFASVPSAFITYISQLPSRFV